MVFRLPRWSSALRWIPAVLVAGLICYWSVVTAPPPITLEMPPLTGADIMQATTVPSDLAWLDARHSIAYATLALSLEYALGYYETTSPQTDERRSHERTIARTVLLVLTVTIGYGALIEAGQLFRPDRVASLADAASNGVGATAALVLSGPIWQSHGSRRSR